MATYVRGKIACFKGLSNAPAGPRGLGRPLPWTPSPHAPPAPKSQKEEGMTVAQETARPSIARPASPNGGAGPWKARPRHPRSSRRPPRPHKASGRSATAQSPEPRWRHPRTPTFSTRIAPSPAAAGTSSGRRSGGRVSPPGFPSLTSFPVCAGGVGRRRSGRSCLLGRTRPRPALPARGLTYFRPK